MELRFPESEIVEIERRYVYPPKEEDILVKLRKEVLKNGYLNKKQLQLVAKWKSPRSAGYVDKNNNEYVEDITRFAFSTKIERSRIEVLTVLDGVSWPTASVLLHFFHKEPYPILDFRALWSVNLEVPKQYTFSIWESYVLFCREISKRNNVDMRTLDRALWQYSKENQR